MRFDDYLSKARQLDAADVALAPLVADRKAHMQRLARVSDGVECPFTFVRAAKLLEASESELLGARPDIELGPLAHASPPPGLC